MGANMLKISVLRGYFAKKNTLSYKYSTFAPENKKRGASVRTFIIKITNNKNRCPTDKGRETMTTTNNTTNAAKNAQKKVQVIATSYADRMRDHMTIARTPSKAIKNAEQTAKAGADLFGKRYAQAVAAVFDTKNADQMRAALQYLCERYKGRTPIKGYSEYYVHQYFEKLIKTNATTCAACWNYLATKRAAEQNAKTAGK